MYTEPRYLELVELIRGADARYVHLEMLFHDYEHAPTDKRSGTFMRCDPKFIADLQWMGFQMMSTAHNHSIDFGEGGILKNIENLNKYGVVHAGSGRNLAEARAPAYLETAKGRVALLSGTTTLFPWGRAADQRRDFQGRPGANLLRHQTEYTVDKATFDHMQRIGAATRDAAQTACAPPARPPITARYGHRDPSHGVRQPAAQLSQAHPGRQDRATDHSVQAGSRRHARADP